MMKCPFFEPITVTILTKNSERYLKEVLDSVVDFPEVLLLDSGSTDRTFSIAENYPNVSIYEQKFLGFGPQHNRANELAKFDWILSLDSDEVLSSELANELKQCDLDPNTVYRFPRYNFFNGKWIKGCGWSPDRQLRLFHRKKTQFSDVQVHESVQTEGMKVKDLQFGIKHYSYENTREFLHKMQVYSDLFVEDSQGKKRSSPWKAIGHGLWTFIRCYFLQKGCLDGFEGFFISVYNANTAFYKYVKLMEWERNRN